VLAELLPGRKFRQANAEPLRVTFHDPCYLGRHNKDYLTPRAVLGALPGLELAEMDRAMGDALCCGGGGGNFFTDVLGGGADSSCRVRVREAAETGAQVLAVACPKCAKMFDDAIKVENLEDGLRVMDLAEIVEERAA
jgi:Fe-S oxidoreductase